MKKLILTLVMSAFAFSSFAMQATVVSAKGKAEMKTGGGWFALKAGDSIDQGTEIQTGFKSELVLKIKESTVTVAPLSRLTIQTLAEREGIKGASGKDETAIRLATGSLKSNVQKTADRRVGFTVRSPVATASVRGTNFTFTTRFRRTALRTNSGFVAFWKNTRQSERILDAILKAIEENAEENKEEAAKEEVAATEDATANTAQEKLGTEPGDISEFAPSNAITVAQGEVASASTNSPSLTTPSQSAQNESNSIGEGTKTAADTESGSGIILTSGKSQREGYGSAIVTIGFDPE